MNDSEDNVLDRLLAELDEVLDGPDDNDREVFARLKTRDGRPIVMGGTYYGASDGKPWKVVGYGREHVWCDSMPEQGRRIRPEWLMAKRDTWERVRADALKDAADYCSGRPWVKCEASAVRLDLVGRCEALAGAR